MRARWLPPWSAGVCPGRVRAPIFRSVKRIARGVSVLLLLALGGSVSAPPGDRAPERWAVLVGITHYPALGGGDGGHLPGAERDARAMRDVLVGRWGLRQENINLLLNEQATRAGIEEALGRWLPERARPGDHVLVYFAGYGSRIPDESGDEDDGLDETLVPADGRADDVSLDIVDDDWAEWLRRLPTDLVVYVHDASNGGGATRVGPSSRSRHLERDLEALHALEGSDARTVLDGAFSGSSDDPSGMDVAHLDVLELAAAHPGETAVDTWFEADEGTEPFAGGAFTTFLVRELWRASATATYETLVDRVAEALQHHRFGQTPRLVGPAPMKAHPPLGVEGDEGAGPGAAIPVTVVRGDEVEVGAGLALGLTSGSVLASPGGARLRITDLTRDRARASIESGSVDEGERVGLLAYRYPARPLRVAPGGDEAATPAGGVSAVGRLAAMDNPVQPFEVELTLAEAPAASGSGAATTVAVRSRQPGYLTLVHLGDDGTVTLVYPNPAAPRARIGAGETRTVPSQGMGSGTPVQALAGGGLFRAFVTREPVDLPLPEWLLSGGGEVAEAVVNAIAAAAGLDGDAVILEGWATASLRLPALGPTP